MNQNNCKIGSIDLQNNFSISHFEKRIGFILNIKGVSIETHYKFSRLINHFVNCDIKHEKLTYSGHISIRTVSGFDEGSYPQNIMVWVYFEV